MLFGRVPFIPLSYRALLLYHLSFIIWYLYLYTFAILGNSNDRFEFSAGRRAARTIHFTTYACRCGREVVYVLVYVVPKVRDWR